MIEDVWPSMLPPKDAKSDVTVTVTLSAKIPAQVLSARRKAACAADDMPLPNVLEKIRVAQDGIEPATSNITSVIGRRILPDASIGVKRQQYGSALRVKIGRDGRQARFRRNLRASGAVPAAPVLTCHAFHST